MGCGSIGSRYARLLYGERLAPFCSRVLLWDIVPALVTNLASEIGATTVQGYEEGLAECDAVLICTWPASHIALALQAIGRCERVLIEKPLALTGAFIENLKARVRQADTLLSVSCNWRFHPSVLRAHRESYAANELELEFAIPPSSAAAHCGGVLFDLGSHAVDLASHFLGSVRETIEASDGDGVLRLRLAHRRGDSLLNLSYSDQARRWLRCGKRRYELRPTDLMYEYQLQRFLGTTNPPNRLGEAAATLDVLLGIQEELACRPSL